MRSNLQALARLYVVWAGLVMQHERNVPDETRGLLLLRASCMQSYTGMRSALRMLL